MPVPTALVCVHCGARHPIDHFAEDCPVCRAKGAPAKSTEKFVERVITDTDHGGMRAATIHLPEKWHFESKIEWHYGWVEYPLSFPLIRKILTTQKLISNTRSNGLITLKFRLN